MTLYVPDEPTKSRRPRMRVWGHVFDDGEELFHLLPAVSKLTEGFWPAPWQWRMESSTAYAWLPDGRGEITLHRTGIDIAVFGGKGRSHRHAFSFSCEDPAVAQKLDWE